MPEAHALPYVAAFLAIVVPLVVIVGALVAIAARRLRHRLTRARAR